MVTRESEWDDLERDKMLALAEFESGVCDCGVHSSLSHDKSNYFKLVEGKCPLCASLEVQGRIRAQHDAAAAKSAEDHPARPLPSDGRRLALRQVSPAELEAAKAAQQSPTTQ